MRMGNSHTQVRALLEQALERETPADREALLAAYANPDVADEVRTLLGFESRAAAIERAGAAITVPPQPESIGPYRILGLLGTGGMGAVYHGVRDDGSFRKDVAIKVVRDVYSAEQRMRFARERELLARLEHPAIARILDGGTTDAGQPWMAIERVDGLPLDQFVRDRQLRLRERMALLIRILDAVQFAHQNLIVHRDLKPANVLVQSDGMPKLLDFGVAKLLGEVEHTQTAGRAPMTFAYAAPEQIRGDTVTTATDVYALGVMLYELLTGERPHKAKGENSLSLLQAITDTDATAPSECLRRRGSETLTARGMNVRELRGDLDTIVLKALSRDPARRYASAQVMRDDLDRYLNNRPIQARPDTFGYRAKKWIRRNRLSAAIATLASIGILIAALLVIQERNRAIKNAQVAEATKRFVLKAFTGANRWVTGENLTARDLALRGLAEVETELKDQPEARIEMYEVLAKAFYASGPLQSAIQATEAQIRDMKLLGRYSSAELLDIEMRLLMSYSQAEEFAKALELRRSIEQDYAEQLSAYDRMILLQLGVQMGLILGDFASVDHAMPGMLDPGALAAAVKSRPDRRESAEAFASFAYRYVLDARVRQRRDREVTKFVLEMAKTAERDLGKNSLQRANFGSWVADYLLAVSRDPAVVALEERASQWNEAQFGFASSSYAKVGSLLQDGHVELAAQHYAWLKSQFAKRPDDSLSTCFLMDFDGGHLAIRQRNLALAREHFARTLACGLKASEVLPNSLHERDARAALAYLDLLQGKTEATALALLADEQRHNDDAAWWHSAAWLADWHWQQGDQTQAKTLLEALRSWHQDRGARFDVELLAQFKRAELPVPVQPDFDVAEAVRIGNSLLADGERIREERLAKQRNGAAD